MGVSEKARTAYRKIAQHRDKLEAYVDSTDDVPTQGEFIRFATGTEKAGLGELLPAPSPAERGQGRSGKKSSKADLLDFTRPTIAAYRKLAAHKAGQ